MDGVKAYEALYGRLLFDRPFRERLRAGDWSEVGEPAETFSDVDFERMEKLAAEIRNGLIRGNLGGLALVPSFSGTIEALGGGVEAVTDRFLAAYREVEPYDCTGRMAGVSVFESFFDWAEPQLADRPDERRRAQHELAAALLAALARTPHPGFLICWPLIRRVGRHWICVLDAARPLDGPDDAPQQPAAFAVVAGRYTTGPMALAFAAAALEGVESAPPWLAEQISDLDPQTLDELRAILAAGN